MTKKNPFGISNRQGFITKKMFPTWFFRQKKMY